MPYAWKSRVVDYHDYWDWYEEACRLGLTDGLPLAPPTEERVAAILDYLGRDPQEVIGVIPPRNGVLTVELLAVQCAMAGCLPQYVPIVEAAVEAMLDPAFNLHGVQCTTNPCAPLVIVNGPVVQELGFNAGAGCFGGGSRANAAVGRAVRLILWNVGGGIPGQTDMTPHGQPAKYAFCVAENEAESPWEPLSVERGLEPGQNAVTVFACQSPQPLFVPGNAERVLKVIATSLPTTGVNMFHAAGQFLLTFSLTPAKELARAGWSKADVKQWIWENARYHLGSLRQSGVLVEGEGHQYYWGHGEPDAPHLPSLPDDTRLPMVRSADDIHILVAGSENQWWVGFSPGWGNYGGFAVTRPVRMPR